jgi:hypothetical protein
MSVAAPSKLPLWRTIGQAYAVWARNFPDLVRTCWLWMLLMAPVLAILRWWQEHADIMQAAARTGQPFVASNPLLTMVMGIVGLVVMLPALASVAVAWHRLLLRDEHPGHGVYLRLDRIVAGYAIRAFWIGAITLAPSYVSKMTFYIKLSASIAASPDVVAAFAATRATAISMFALASLGSVIALLIVARLSLALPGIALGRDGVTLGSAWRVSKRNTWRMYWAHFFCILPWGAISDGASFVQSRATVTLVRPVMGLLWIPVGMVSVGMLSLAYRHFFERPV